MSLYKVFVDGQEVGEVWAYTFAQAEEKAYETYSHRCRDLEELEVEEI